MGTKTRWPFGIWATATGCVALAAVVTGLIGWHSYLGSKAEYVHANLVDQLYYTLQLFVLGPSPFGVPPYGWFLSIASFLAPLSTVMALLQAVSTTVRNWSAARKLRKQTGHDVVVGGTPEALVLAQRLAAQHKGRGQAEVVLLGSGVGDDVARRHGLRVVAADPVDEEALQAAGVPGAARVFALTVSGATNARVALYVQSLHAKSLPTGSPQVTSPPAPQHEESPRRTPSHPRGIAVHARVDNAELGAAMRARRLAAEGDTGFRVDFFSINAIAAVALLDEYRAGPDSVVVGSDPFAQAVQRELERRRRRMGPSDPVLLVPSTRAENLAPPSQGCTYVCETEADEVLRIGLHLMLADHPHVVLCLGRKAALADALGQRLFHRVNEMSVFGILDTACDPDRLTGNALIEQLARALHAYYLRAYGGTGQASHVPWVELDERLKEDNREQADDIGRKLASIRAVIVPTAPLLPAFSFSKGEVEKLAEMEHVRWMENKERAGIVLGPERTDTTHPDMLPWKELDEAVQEKDRTFIRGLPALLEAEDLAIVRRPLTDSAKT